jgi:hypothetical protein
MVSDIFCATPREKLPIVRAVKIEGVTGSRKVLLGSVAVKELERELTYCYLYLVSC